MQEKIMVVFGLVVMAVLLLGGVYTERNRLAIKPITAVATIVADATIVEHRVVVPIFVEDIKEYGILEAKNISRKLEKGEKIVVERKAKTLEFNFVR